VCVVCVLAISAAGCEMLGLSEPEQPPPAPPTQNPPPSKPPAQAPPVAAQGDEEPKDYQRPEYPENQRRNPFVPDETVMRPIGSEPSAEDLRPLEPLEQFALGELSLAAIISEVVVPKAMFVDPQGFGHVVKEGDRIGRQGGIVVDIRDNEVDVRENGTEEGSPAQVRTMRLRDAELVASSSADGLSDNERAALEKLMTSEKGRRAIQQRFEDRAEGARAMDGAPIAPPRNSRYRAIEPPR
ncbi:MAG: pilus assembly protein PilP, partial [Myxococcota bacterium]